MALDDVAQEPADDPRNRWISIWIGVVAVLLALCSMGGDNATKDANKSNVDAANLWAFFQAKNVRRTEYTIAIEQMQLQLVSQPQMPPAARQQVEAKIAEYKATVARFTSDKERNEGLDELFKRARDAEQQRDDALRRDPYFDWSQALLQIAIVLASVSIVARNQMLLYSSMGLGGVGSILLLFGFFI
jgi:lipopolysaccharide export LptBFGC system permease protein LptF